MGYPVSEAGDVNGDGFDDVIIWGYTKFGALYYGGQNMDDGPDVNFSFRLFSQNAVSSAGDVNNDGYDDVIMGNYFTNNATIYYGGQEMDNVEDITLTGDPSSSFGFAVSSAGDVNGDGYDDVIVGAPDYKSGGVTVGRAYIFLGGITMDNGVYSHLVGSPY